jgi:hypothetical protein
MPKVKYPLFSGDVRGQFGKSIIFTRGGVARKYFKPRDPKSAAQLAVREAFKEFVVAGLTQEQADLLYAAIGHLHDDRYSQLGHDHDLLYLSSSDSRVVRKNDDGGIFIGASKTIADNGVDTLGLDFLGSLYVFLIQMRAGATEDNWVLGSCKANSPSVCVAYIKGSNVDVGIGALTGTTGTDGKMTVSVYTDGKLYIENRTGLQRNFGYKIF